MYKDQYDIDLNRFVELFSRYTGISKSKLKSFIKDNPINYIFEHPTALDINERQLERIRKLRELHSLYQNLHSYEKPYVMDASALAQLYFTNFFKGLNDREYFACSFLNTRCGVIRTKILASGTVDEAAIHVREVIKEALFYDASGVIIAHNHPGGSITPSPADKSITIKLGDALRAVKISLHDHIIVSGNSSLSFATENYPLYSNSLGHIREVNNPYNNYKDTIIRIYEKEFPEIKHISNDTAKAILESFTEHNCILSIKELKSLYEHYGMCLEVSFDVNHKQMFDKLQSIVDDLKRAQLTERNMQASVKQTKSFELEMA